MQHRSDNSTALPELALLLACARVRVNERDVRVIRKMLEQSIDWTAFARKAIVHGLAGLAGHTLVGVAPDMVPGDILDALTMNLEQARRKNRVLFLELVRLVEVLANGGIEAIPLQGPILCRRTYGDLGFRAFEHLHLLVHDSDMNAAIAVLRGLGYERRKQLTVAQLDLTRRVQGHELLFKKALGIGLNLHPRLTTLNVALDIDYGGLWRRAQRATLNGRTIPTLSPEDELLVLTIPDDKHLPWSIGWACDAATFIGSHPALDWTAIVERARAQGCLRMVLVACSLARQYFDASVPSSVTSREPAVKSMVGRIAASWHHDQSFEFPDDNSCAVDWLRLHDGAVRRIRHVMRRLFLPEAQHIARMRLPGRFTVLPPYVPLKIAHDIALLPLVRGYRNLRAQMERLGYVVANYEPVLALVPIPAKERLRLKRFQAARAEAKRALNANPNDLAAWRDLGDALFGLRHYAQSITCYEKVLASAPDSPLVWSKRAGAIRADRTAALGRTDEQRIPDPDDANAWVRRAGYLSASRRFSEAAAASDRALSINPKQLVAMRIGIRSRIACCDWRQRDEDERRIAEGLRANISLATPFNHRAISDSEADNLLVARLWAKGIAQPPEPLCHGAKYRHERIRVAYLSAEFHDHPTAIHIVGAFEHHDKTRFETTAISLGPYSASKLRDRIEAASDHFIDMETMSDVQAAKMIREMEIDIAVDLNGHAGAARPGILAQRPAAVQVSYLGNAGTTGAPFLDYIIADATVVPGQHFPYYTEKVVHLPNSYQCNDSRRYLPRTVPSRVDAELPETGFVYCCFNSNYKITPVIFDVWMRLLKATPGSVLWQLCDDPYTIRNLRREASARGIGPERLVFAPNLPVEDHLARLGLADLFLDTLPMNAHATASDALWAGLPVLTCLGNTFGGRVGASLLRAIGLPELVTASLAEYEAVATLLARDPEQLAHIRAKLVRNRGTEPLFDTTRFTRDLETSYSLMWERQQKGQPPAGFSVERIPACAA